MGDPRPRKRLKLSCGDTKIAISVLSTCSVKEACKAAEDALERKDVLGKRKVRTFMLLPDEIELDEEELVADVVEEELLQPVFFEVPAAPNIPGADAAASSSSRKQKPLLVVKYALASAPSSESAKIVRVVADDFSALHAAIASEQGGAVGLFTSNGIELKEKVEGCEILSDFLAEIQGNGGEMSKEPSLFVVVGNVQGCKMASQRFGLTEAWQPEVKQTDKAMAAFLSTLFVVAAHAPKKVCVRLMLLYTSTHISHTHMCLCFS